MTSCCCVECPWLILPAAPFAGRVAHALVTRTPDLVSASFVWRPCFAFSLDRRSLRARTATQCASFPASRRRFREPKLDTSQKHASVASQCACVAVAGLRSALAFSLCQPRAVALRGETSTRRTIWVLLSRARKGLSYNRLALSHSVVLDVPAFELFLPPVAVPDGRWPLRFRRQEISDPSLSRDGAVWGRCAHTPGQGGSG
jgi:hypothetical protein